MINDLPTITNSLKTAVKQKEQNLHQCNEDLSEIGYCLKITKLTLNQDKTTNINFIRKIIIGTDQIKIGIDDFKKASILSIWVFRWMQK